MPHFPNKGERPPWRATVLTLFPEMFPGPLAISLVGGALQAGLWSLRTVPIREFGIGRHRAVDDTPAGGGAGMVMRADVLAAAIDAAQAEEADTPLIYLSPRGEPLTPGAGRRAGRRSRRAAAGRPLRRGRRARHRRAPHARGFDRRLRAVGRRDRRHGAHRRLRAPAARRHRRRRLAGGGKLRERPARVPAIHQAARVGGPRHPRCAAIGRPQEDRRVAPPRGRTHHRRAPPRPPRSPRPSSAAG